MNTQGQPGEASPIAGERETGPAWERLVYDKARLRKDLREQARALRELEAYAQKLEQTYAETLGSTSWRLTAPLRALMRRLRGLPFQRFEPRLQTDAEEYDAHRPAAVAALSDRERGKNVRDYLWVGHEAQAEADLRALIADETCDPAARVDASFALATWLDFLGQTDAARAVLDDAEALALAAGMGARRRVRLGVLAARDGRDEEARALFGAAAAARNRFDPNLTLLRSNVTEDETERLDRINRVYAKAGLAPLRKTDPAAPLGLHNITADAPETEVPDLGLVSVIMPIFEAEATVATAVRSMLDQTYRNLEVILVDDCSGDGTWDLLQRLAAAEPRVRAVKAPMNGGPYRARNLGLTVARGRFVTTHDADDWSHPQKIACQMARFARYPDCVANSTFWARASEDLRFTSGWRLSETAIFWNHSSFLFRREVVDLLGGWDPVRVSGDTEFIWRVESSFGPNAVRRSLPEVPLSIGLDSDGSLTRTKTSHVSTIHAGLRFYYREISRYWQLRETVATSMESRARKLRMIPSAMRFRGVADPPVEAVLQGDCSDPATVAAMRALALSRDGRLGVAHLPAYDLARPLSFDGRQLCDAFFELLDLPHVRIALPDEVACAAEVVAIPPSHAGRPAAALSPGAGAVAALRSLLPDGTGGGLLAVGPGEWLAQAGLDPARCVPLADAEAVLAADADAGRRSAAILFAEGLPEGPRGPALAAAALAAADLVLVLVPSAAVVDSPQAGTLTAEQWAVECFARPALHRVPVEEPDRPATGRATLIGFAAGG